MPPDSSCQKQSKSNSTSRPVLGVESRRVERNEVNETPNGEAGELWTSEGSSRDPWLSKFFLLTRPRSAHIFLYCTVVEVMARCIYIELLHLYLRANGKANAPLAYMLARKLVLDLPITPPGSS